MDLMTTSQLNTLETYITNKLDPIYINARKFLTKSSIKNINLLYQIYIKSILCYIYNLKKCKSEKNCFSLLEKINYISERIIFKIFKNLDKPEVLNDFIYKEFTNDLFYYIDDIADTVKTNETLTILGIKSESEIFGLADELCRNFLNSFVRLVIAKVNLLPKNETEKIIKTFRKKQKKLLNDKFFYNRKFSFKDYDECFLIPNAINGNVVNDCNILSINKDCCFYEEESIKSDNSLKFSSLDYKREFDFRYNYFIAMILIIFILFFLFRKKLRKRN